MRRKHWRVARRLSPSVAMLPPTAQQARGHAPSRRWRPHRGRGDAVDTAHSCSVWAGNQHCGASGRWRRPTPWPDARHCWQRLFDSLNLDFYGCRSNTLRNSHTNTQKHTTQRRSALVHLGLNHTPVGEKRDATRHPTSLVLTHELPTPSVGLVPLLLVGLSNRRIRAARTTSS